MATQLHTETVRSIKVFLGVFVLVLGLGFGVLNVQNQVNFRQKAAEPDTTASKIAEIAKEIGESSGQNNSNYLSQAFAYKVDFDTNYWTTTDNLNPTNTNLSQLNFSLNQTAGIAQVNFEAFGQSDFLKRIMEEKNRNANITGDNLDLVTNNVIRGKNPVQKQRIKRNGRDYYKITYNSSFLGVTNEYYEYITVNSDNYYIITAKYPTFGDAKKLSEELVDSFSFLPKEQNIKGASTETPLANTLTESKVVELTKPSVFEIAHLYCNEVVISNTSGLKFLKPNYVFCNGSLGTGFAINEIGDVATNGHVVKSYPEMALVESLLYRTPSAQDFFIDLIKELSVIQTGEEVGQEGAHGYLNQINSDPLAFQSFVTLIYKMMQQNVISLKDGANKHFVKLANDPMIIDTNKSGVDILQAIQPSKTVKEAELVAYNFPNVYSIDSILNNQIPTGSDVAIIRIKNPEKLVFPSINLGTSEGIKEGSSIVVIGYPGLVSGAGGNSLINERSSATPTVTRGIVSAVKSDQGGLKLIQVDASIDHGNSGGPAIDMEGRVIGIATYGIGSQSGNYNFLRDIEDLKKLADQNLVTTAASPTYNSWAEGLAYFWVEHYRQATIPFDKVKEGYSIHPSIAEYISDSQTAIEKGEDKSGLLFLLRTSTKAQIILVVSILAIAGIGVAIIIAKKRRHGPDLPDNTQNTSTPPVTLPNPGTPPLPTP